MNTIKDMLMPLNTAQGGAMDTLILTLLMSFIVGQLNAWCYKWTHRGLSYTRTFTQALILICVVTSMAMAMILANPLAAFGLLGGVAIIRFRTIVRDARDNVYVLLALICGMAAGLGFYLVAIVGSLAANGIAIYLHRTAFGSWRAMESLLRFQVDGAAFERAPFDAILGQYCRDYSVVSVDDAPSMGPTTEPSYQLVYRVRLKDPEQAKSLVAALQTSGAVQSVHLLVDQENEDIE